MKKQLILGSILCVLFLGFVRTAGAVSLTLGDAHELGFVNFGIPSGDADRTTYVNVLIGMALGTTFDDTGAGGTGQFYRRSNNDFGPLAPAVFDHNGTSTSIDLGTGGFGYLFAKYDGPNYGSEVWDLTGLTGIITIPAFASQYGLSSWSLFNPGSGNTVPDGGSTVALLGLALTGLAGIRARLGKS